MTYLVFLHYGSNDDLPRLSFIRRPFASLQRIASFHQLLSPRSLPETSTGETSDSRFSDELQQGRLNMDVVFTIDVDDVHDDQALETGKAGVSCPSRRWRINR